LAGIERQVIHSMIEIAGECRGVGRLARRAAWVSRLGRNAAGLSTPPMILCAISGSSACAARSAR